MTERYTENTINELLRHFNKGDNSIIKTTPTGDIIRFETTSRRSDIVAEILNLFVDAEIEKDNKIVFKNSKTKIYVKPKGRSGIRSSGIENEKNFTDFINNLVKENSAKTEGISIKFVPNYGSATTYENVISAEMVGTDTVNRKKADVLLKTYSGKEIPISLKKNNAEYWESSDTLLGDYARELVKKKILSKETKLIEYTDKNSSPISILNLEKINPNKIYRLEEEIHIPLDDKMIEDVCFGSDIIKDHGCIIKHTFSGLMNYETQIVGNGKNKSTVFVVKIGKLYSTVDDIKKDSEDRPHILVRNDKTRNSKKIGIRGLRCLVAYAKRINKNRK